MNSSGLTVFTPILQAPQQVDRSQLWIMHAYGFIHSARRILHVVAAGTTKTCATRGMGFKRNMRLQEHPIEKLCRTLLAVSVRLWYVASCLSKQMRQTIANASKDTIAGSLPILRKPVCMLQPKCWQSWGCGSQRRKFGHNMLYCIYIYTILYYITIL